jgi:glycosyltransferase involved in cell wall biosynthesis
MGGPAIAEMADPSAVSVVIPAMNEGASVGPIVRELAALAAWREILVIDDGSSDDTADQAAAAGARVVRHPYNKGNGAAVKSGIRASTGEYILIIDGDGQHSPADAVRLASRLGEYDLVVGARSLESQAGSVRRWGNTLLNRLASFLTERRIPDLTSGFRGARRSCLVEFMGLLPNGFSTPATTTLCFLKAGYSVFFQPVEARDRVGTSKIRLSRDGPKFLLIILRVITIFSPFRIFLPIAATSFLVGAAYAVWTALTQRHITNSSVILIVFAVMVFLVGLVSEQISAMRSDGRR